ncbi:Uncharacterised protein [Chlamydia trachomatis]|nr:Uncharacterised protein [Chlamydia trachomatis]
MLKESNVNMVLTVSLVNLKFPTVKPSLFLLHSITHTKSNLVVLVNMVELLVK